MASLAASDALTTEWIRVRGLVQGVGFRPTVWRLARQLEVCGEVLNDGEGVLILAQASAATLDVLTRSLYEACPPLARIDSIERKSVETATRFDRFDIVASLKGNILTGIVPDAASCPDCIRDITDPTNRRFGYAFTNCTHCGPRLSIVRALPYDRANTSMAEFQLCPACRGEYENPADRRFHAQPNACPVCGPTLWLETPGGDRTEGESPVADAARLLKAGHIVAIKGIGGVHLACDARNETAVRTLRQRKQRPAKPLAVMVKNVESARRYCQVSPLEAAALGRSDAPIVVLDRTTQGALLAPSVAPGQRTIGVMLPYSPLHSLLMEHLDGPIILTSGNRSDEPQCISNEDARLRLADIADYFLLHNRDIENRIDDSVVRDLGDGISVLRRARGMAPASIALPPGFADAADLLAMGAELKYTFCLLQQGRAILSQHLGDLEDLRTWEDCQHHLQLYQHLFHHAPQAICCDEHPEYLSTKFAIDMADERGLPLLTVPHHHAHIAACLADNAYPLCSPPVLGIAMDGLGFGGDGALWGGEFLLASYTRSTRLAHLKATAMPGGAQAAREPWRNTFAQLAEAWPDIRARYADLPAIRHLQTKPLETLARMMTLGRNAPPASSCGRLFDAVAAALGICADRTSYEGQAAMELEALVDLALDEHAYPFSVSDGVVDPAPMWPALLDDLATNMPAEVIASRFHRGLAVAISAMTAKLRETHLFHTVALSGGVFQNKTLLTLCREALARQGLTVLSHRNVPANDGGIALGQAVIAAATLMRRASECA